MPQIKFKNSVIEYIVKGEGKPVVLLHGYLESLNVWGSFADELSKKHKIISIDLPGHGNSGIFDEIHTMKLMAESVNSVLEVENTEKCSIIGHSMGGYVLMQFMEMYPEKLETACLFHSSPFADDDDKKKIREQLIEAIRAGKKVLLAKDHVEKTFAIENIDKFTQEIGFLKVIAVNTSNEGTIAALEGMKIRKDTSATLLKTKIPILWIFGKKDNFIHINIKDSLKLPKNIKVEVLKKSGHQGFIEEPEKSLKIVKKFLN